MESEVRPHGRLRGQTLKTLEGRNTRLKRLLADAMLDNVALKDLLGKKWWCPLREKPSAAAA
jgi:hypothetical protein